jgi:hypothetical protein
MIRHDPTPKRAQSTAGLRTGQLSAPDSYKKLQAKHKDIDIYVLTLR